MSTKKLNQPLCLKKDVKAYYDQYAEQMKNKTKAPDFKDVKSQIKKQLESQEKQKEVQKEIDQLKKSAKLMYQFNHY